MAAGNLWVNLGLRTAAFDRGMKSSRGKIRGFGSEVKSLNKTIRGVGAALGVSFGAYAIGSTLRSSVREFASFEKQLAQVSTMLDDQSMSHLPRYKEEIRSLSVDMGESTATLSRGLYDILSASVDASKAMKVLRVSARAAKAGITETSVSERAGEVSDDLFTIVKRGKTTFADLAPNIGKVAALAATAGISFDDLGATIATLTRGGAQTEIAMTGVRSIITQLIDPSKEAAEAAAELGLQLDANTLSSLGLVGIFEKLRKALAIAIKQADAAGRDYEAMLNSAGATEKAYGKMVDTTAHKLDQAAQAWIDLKRTIGEKVAPTLINLINDLRWLVDHMPKIREEAHAAAKAMGLMEPVAIIKWDPNKKPIPSAGAPTQIDTSGRTPLSELRDRGVMPLEQRRMGTEAYHAELLAQQEQYNEHKMRLQLRDIKRTENAYLEHLAKQKQIADEIARKWEQVGHTMEYSLTSAFDRMAWEGEKFGDAMQSMLRDVAREMSRVMIFQPFTQGFMGLFGHDTTAAPAPIPVKSYQHGGYVPETGLYKLHAGEEVKRAGTVGRDSPNVTIILENKSGVPLQAEPARIELDKIVVGIVSENIQTRGQLWHDVRGRD
jgi:hypothetical protein